MSDLHTDTLHDLVARFQAGDNAALDVLIPRAEDRLALFTRRMLGDFPAVRAGSRARMSFRMPWSDWRGRSGTRRPAR